MDEFISYRDISEKTYLCSDYGISEMFSSIAGYFGGGTAASTTAAASTGAATASTGAATGSTLSTIGSTIATYAPLALSLAGTAISTAAEANQASAQAAIGTAQAEQIRAETNAELRANRIKARAIAGENATAAAASGLQPFQGSPLEVSLANAYEQGINQSLIQYGGLVKQRAAQLGAYYAKSSIPSTYLRGGLTTLGKIYTQYKTASLNP